MAGYKCPKCNSVNYVDGMVNGGDGIGFMPEGAPWYKVFTLKRVAARACVSCGYLELYTEGNDMQDSAYNPKVAMRPGKLVFAILFAVIFIFIAVKSMFFNEKHHESGIVIQKNSGQPKN